MASRPHLTATTGAKEKGKKKVITAAAALAAVAVLVLLLTTVIIPNGHVNRGKEAFAQGNYAEAVEAFTAAGERANELKHDAAYALGDERLQKMVLSRVQTIEKSITGVAVTDDAAKVAEIEKLSEQLDNAQDLGQITAAMESMLSEFTVYRE